MTLTPRQTSLTVGTTAIDVCNEVTQGANIALVFVNTSTGGQAISISFDQDAVAGQGIVLYPTGTHSEFLDPAFTPEWHRVSAVASGAGGTLAIHQRVR